MKIQNLFGLLLKVFTFFAVLGILLLSAGLFFYAFYQIIEVVELVVLGTAKEGEIILKSLKAMDVSLLGVVFFLIGLGLFELFIGQVDNLPDWAQIKDIDQLKTMLVKVSIIVMGVSFTGKIVTWKGETNILYYGIGLGVVIFALSYFLSVKNKSKD